MNSSMNGWLARKVLFDIAGMAVSAHALENSPIVAGIVLVCLFEC